MLGTNDLRNRWAKPEEEVSAEEMIAGLQQLAVRARTHGIAILGATLTPFENETFLPGAWTPERAMALLVEESGTGFDPRCVDALRALTGVEPEARDDAQRLAA